MAPRQKTIHSLLPAHNGLTDDNRKAIIALLQQQLADHYILVTKTKFYHWNVDGPEFHDLHELFDEQYEIIADQVDEIAEQCLKLGGQSTGTLAWFKEHTRLKEDEGDSIPDTRRMISTLLADHEAVITALHSDIKKIDGDYDDAVTSNLLQDISDEHQKMAWMLRVTLQPSTLES